jgi:hypothetical protein
MNRAMRKNVEAAAMQLALHMQDCEACVAFLMRPDRSDRAKQPTCAEYEQCYAAMKAAAGK